MPPSHLIDSICPCTWNEPDRILPLLTPSPCWADFLLLWRCLPGMAWLLWGWHPYVCHCPVLVCQSFRMAPHEDLTRSWICYCWCSSLYVFSTSIGGHYAVHCGSIHHPYLHHGVAGSGQGGVLQWSLDLDQTLRLHGSYFFRNFWHHDRCQQVQISGSIPAPDNYADVLCCPTGNIPVCSWQPYWWASGEDPKTEIMVKSLELRNRSLLKWLIHAKTVVIL